MKRVFFVIFQVLIFTICLDAQTSRPLYPSDRKPPEKNSSTQQETALQKQATSPAIAAQQANNSNMFPIIGTDFGLYRVTDNETLPLWQEGAVYKIVKTPDGSSPQYYFLTDKGVIVSDDLVTFTERNNGLPFLTIKEYDGIKKTFRKQIQNLKDLKVHPENPQIVITTTRAETFISKDAGQTWKSLGFSSKTMGAKSVAVASLPVSETGTETELIAFLAHSLYGLSYIKVDAKNPAWIDMNLGFNTIKTMTAPDELSDISAVLENDMYGNKTTSIYVGQSFARRLYKINWEHKCAQMIYREDNPNNSDWINGTFDSLSPVTVDTGTLIYLTRDGGFARFDTRTGEITNQPAIAYIWNKYINKADYHPSCALFYPGMTGASITQCVSLSELWLLYPEDLNTQYSTSIEGVKSLYVPIRQAVNPKQLNEHLKTLKTNKLNSIVLDMKDDYGILHYQTKDPLVLKKGYVSKYSFDDLEAFVETMKNEKVKLIARIVVFKDKNLYQYEKNKYAILDSKTGKPWLGIKGYNEDNSANYYDEHWVDPYSEEVWEYNIAIAKELISRGFDEIQFDYIRFPTDGKNLYQTKFRYRDAGMDKESALVSFLSYARKNIDAPIGIDIYGANGWYRSGTRTGQDVELMASYVDIICPMFYPNHFGQGDMAFEPMAERPYRIYYYGTYRNTVIARNQVLVRPWVQAFFLKVSYDIRYYDKNYVRREVYGVRDSINKGYMYWNNSGRYEDISPDPTDEEPYPWKQGGVQ